jgi:cytidyltransferase-like protein
MTISPGTPSGAAPRVIYTRMVADLFHPGHVAFLKAARALGDSLHVYVLEEAFIGRIKPLPIMAQSERLAVVEACRYVDAVHATGPLHITREFMHERGYSLYAFGYANEREANAKQSNCRDLPEHMIAVIPYTAGISSTILRGRVLARRTTI